MSHHHIDLSSLLIRKIVVHDIPKHKKGDLEIEPNYSERESRLTDGMKMFFKEKVIQSLGSSRSFKISFDEENESPAPWLIDDILNGNGRNLVSKSKLIAKHLFEIQVGNNEAGLLVLIYGKANSKNTCILMKLERDKGAQLKIDPETKAFNIEEVQNLMLTQKTKIFKVALFILKNDFSCEYNGLIMDHQVNIRIKKEVITWFMSKFLGCKAFEDPQITTQRFYKYTKAFINTIEDNLDKAKYIMDLNSYIQRNNRALNPREFADEYLTSTEHKEGYKKYLETKNFNFTSFPKDIAQIEKQVKKITLIFENNIAIIGNEGVLDNSVKLEKLDNGLHKAEIISKIKKIT